MVGHKLGEFALTRIFKSHGMADKKLLEAAAAARAGGAHATPGAPTAPTAPGAPAPAASAGAAPAAGGEKKEETHGNPRNALRGAAVGPEGTARCRPDPRAAGGKSAQSACLQSEEGSAHHQEGAGIGDRQRRAQRRRRRR